MSILLYSNNAKTALSSPINSTDTTIHVSSGTGDEFPTIVSSEYAFYATISDPNDATINEIVKVTARTGDTFTVIRSQQDTTSPISGWTAGSVFSQNITAGDMDNFLQREELVEIANPPVGSIMAWTSTTYPNNYLPCDGSSISIAAYPALYQILGNTFGSAPSGFFKLPDLRGQFVRVANTTSTGYDPNRTIGSAQTQAIASHTHTIPYVNSAVQQNGSGQPYNPVPLASVLYTTFTGDTETRPTNFALTYIIRAKLIF